MTDIEKYAFTWVGKNQARASAYDKTVKENFTLRPCKEESLNWDKTQNLYIEGDNLKVLQILLESYLHKVKMIYIDPPYNTGNDFIYRDDFKMDADKLAAQINLFDDDGNKNFRLNTNSNPKFHSDWCSMIYARLLVARNLLSDDGVIFISIDDNEQANLKKICDEVFGERNFMGMFVVNASPSAIDYGCIAKMHEYVLMYSKNYQAVHTNQITEKDKEFDYEDSGGRFMIYPLYNGNVAFNPTTRPNLYYPFYLNPNKKIDNDFYEIGLDEKDGWVKVLPVVSKKDNIPRVWRWGKDKARKNLNTEIIGYQTKDGEYRIVQKYRSDKKTIRSLLLDKNISSRRGTAEVQDLMNKKIFQFPKPIELIKQFLIAGADEESIILDFFSGSATTAHAVMQLNADDGGHRKFIMVQLPEPCNEKSEAYKAGYKNICEIGKERIRRAGAKIKNDAPLTTLDLDTGFRVFKLDTTNMRDVRITPAEFTKEKLLDLLENIKSDRTALDLLFESLLKWGVEITKSYTSEEIDGYTIHNYNDGEFIACFDKNITRKIFEYIARKKPRRAIFRDHCFKNDADKINATEIFRYYAPNTRLKVI